MGDRIISGIRYTAIAAFMASLVLAKKDNIDFIVVILVLIFILNNQVRFYIFKRKDLLMLLSVCIELIVLYQIYNGYGGVLFFCFFPTAFDSAFLIKSKLSYLSLAFVLVVTVNSNGSANFRELASTLAAYLILFLLAQHVREEHDGKLEAQGLYDKLRISEEKLIKANSDLENYASSIEELTLLRERNRISREIHDSVGHSLSTVIIQLGAIEKIANTNGPEASAMAQSLSGFVKDSLSEVRAAVRELKPQEFEEYEGLLAIEELIKKFEKFTGVEIKFTFSKERWGLSADKALVAYRAVQEFLSNAVRHGKATKINVYMNFAKEHLIMTMQDNGVGADHIMEGVGLKSIGERAREVGGSISYNSEIGKGFFLKLVINKADKIILSSEIENSTR